MVLAAVPAGRPTPSPAFPRALRFYASESTILHSLLMKRLSRSITASKLAVAWPRRVHCRNGTGIPSYFASRSTAATRMSCSPCRSSSICSAPATSRPAARLVVIGIEGPETARIRRFIAQHRPRARQIVLLHGVSDAELRWCYGHCELLLAPFDRRRLRPSGGRGDAESLPGGLLRYPSFPRGWRLLLPLLCLDQRSLRRGDSPSAKKASSYVRRQSSDSQTRASRKLICSSTPVCTTRPQ